MPDFHKYFLRQWIGRKNDKGVWKKSKFRNWQLFNTPPGYSCTNSPIESYNRQIKHSFTCRVKFDMIPAMKVFEDLVRYESNQICDFVSVGFT